jgi:hypothetical protein
MAEQWDLIQRQREEQQGMTDQWDLVQRRRRDGQWQRCEVWRQRSSICGGLSSKGWRS